MKTPTILGVPMRQLKPKRFDTWIWWPKPRASRHLSVAIYPMDGQLKARIWVLGIPTCVDEQCVESVHAGARWADKKLRGLVKALEAVRP